MSDTVHRYILAYDVTSDTRRTRVAKTLESYGTRLPYSVFLIDAKPAKIVRLKLTVTTQLDQTTDSLLICDLGPLEGRRQPPDRVPGASTTRNNPRPTGPMIANPPSPRKPRPALAYYLFGQSTCPTRNPPVKIIDARPNRHLSRALTKPQVKWDQIWTLSPSAPGRPFIEASSSTTSPSCPAARRRPRRDGPSSSKQRSRASRPAQGVAVPRPDGPSSRPADRGGVQRRSCVAVSAGTALHRGHIQLASDADLNELLAVLAGAALHRGVKNGELWEVEATASARTRQPDELVSISAEVAAKGVMLVHGTPAGQAILADRLRKRGQQVVSAGEWTSVGLLDETVIHGLTGSFDLPELLTMGLRVVWHEAVSPVRVVAALGSSVHP
ncbi:CRISPR-associated endonuclease Cas2 [Actinophytocola sp. S1-96]|uniref:CRISPR-associated endoribonuclease Cas2 n=1 Tax=Actinophytocola gossypii TaxID=2812003 RepID=A0ABT2JIL4_9PSEU|nr:CRISPR-associated endonuclease Cas2 [Actinophytocola gossypii]